MNIIITGGTGFVGSYLSGHFLARGDNVTTLGTRPAGRLGTGKNSEHIQADTSQPGPWQQAVGAADVIINLAGRTIFARWSNNYKQQIYDSRITTTRHVVEALPDTCQAVLISASAVGYYGSCGDTELAETARNGGDFLAQVSRDWEGEALRAVKKGVRVVLTRFGIVLGAGGGALATMLPAFRSFVGGPLGSGRQWFPWIHIRDLAAAVDFLILHRELDGPFNLCAPHPVRNKEMATALGKTLGRPAKMAVPAFMLKALMGEVASVLLGSQRVVPVRLLASGFSFGYPFLDQALADLIQPRLSEPQKP